METNNLLLIHAVKVIEYRFIKATNGSTKSFGDFKISEHTRTPTEIINHMFDLVAKTKSLIVDGHFNIAPIGLFDFEQEKERLLFGLRDLQTIIKTSEIDFEIIKKILQGPVMDITTHIGQIAMLNGLHGNKIPKESYYDSLIN